LKRFIISRTDGLGDVILTLPIAGILKQHFPDCRIYFLGKKYTQPLITGCEFVDEFLDWDELRIMPDPRDRIKAVAKLEADVIVHVFPVKEIESLAKSAKIPLRIGTSHRWFSWLYCNKLSHFSRKKSDLHEALLNIKLLQPLGITKEFTLTEIPSYYGLKSVDRIRKAENKFRLILHPKSKGSAREWGLDNYSKLVDLLPPDRFQISITGTEEEGVLMSGFLTRHKDRIEDMTGKLSLSELLDYINDSDGLVAASTGPLHIAAALGKKAIGIYAPMRPIFPRRWAPLGKNATYFVLDKKCEECRKSNVCECIRAIEPETIVNELMKDAV
jgi:heptosyltransferase III